MAEGGDQAGDDSKENPFSFKKFVEKTNSPESKSPGSDEDDDLSSVIPDLRPETQPKKKTIIVADGKGSKFDSLSLAGRRQTLNWGISLNWGIVPQLRDTPSFQGYLQINEKNMEKLILK